LQLEAFNVFDEVSCQDFKQYLTRELRLHYIPSDYLTIK